MSYDALVIKTPWRGDPSPFTGREEAPMQAGVGGKTSGESQLVLCGKHHFSAFSFPFFLVPRRRSHF